MYVVNIKSHIIHTFGCPFGKRTKKEFKKTYNTYEKALNCLDDKHNKCKNCKKCYPEKTNK